MIRDINTIWKNKFKYSLLISFNNFFKYIIFSNSLYWYYLILMQYININSILRFVCMILFKQDEKW